MLLYKNLQYLAKKNGEELPAMEALSALSHRHLIELCLKYPHSLMQMTQLDLEQVEQVDTSQIKLIVLDVDGVLTDGGMYYDSLGQEQKRFYVKDGLAIARAISRGMEFGIISAGLRSEVVEIRAKMLGIQNVVVSGRTPKIDTLKSWMASKNLTFNQIAYVGDDVNDIAIMEQVGLSACPADAVPRVKKTARVQLLKNGGEGCIREFLDTYFVEI